MALTMLRLLLVAALFYVAANASMIELKVVVDEKAMEVWKEKSGKDSEQDFMETLNSVFYEVEQLLSSLEQWRITMKIRIKTLVLNAKNVVDAPYGEIERRDLDEFRKWMFKEKKYEKGDWDAALFLTGLDIIDHDENMPRFGEFARMCDDRSIAMVEFQNGDYNDAFVIANTIGSLLGMYPDGHGGAGQTCDPADGFIMSPYPKPKSINHFKFSYCSYSHFYERYSRSSWDCIEDGDESKSVKGKRIGELVSADETCKRHLGGDAHVYTATIFGDTVCTSFTCRNEGGKTKEVFTPQGMYCGKNKQCVQGQCIETPNGKASVSDVCPLGDSPRIDYKTYKTCDEVPYWECGVLKYECCKRCNLLGLREADNVCKESLKNPEAWLLREQVKYYGDVLCQSIPCVTHYDGDKPKVQNVASPEGMICGQNERCLNKRCLPTRDNPPKDLMKHCPYGDQPFDKSGQTCRQALDANPQRCRTDNVIKKRCCAYCMYI